MSWGTGALRGVWAGAWRTVDESNWRGRVAALRRGAKFFRVVHEREWEHTSKRYTMMCKASARRPGTAAIAAPPGLAGLALLGARGIGFVRVDSSVVLE